MAKTWQQKYESGGEPKVEVIEKPFGGIPASGRMLISNPKEIEQNLLEIPRGTTVTLADFRARLAAKHGADGTCPLTTSIFLRIVAERSLEQGLDVPFWRVADPKSPLAKKLSCGPEVIAEMRNRE